MPYDPKVEQLQRTLNAKLRPSPNLKPDGLMGPKTHAAQVAYDRAKFQASSSGAMATAAASPAAAGLSHDERAERWMSIARGELNVTEVPGAASNPTIEGYLMATNRAGAKDDTAWCSAFANWVLKKAGFPAAGIATASSWKTFGYECDARYGAITVVLRNGAQLDQWGAGAHVGFLYDLTSDHYRLLGGNQGQGGSVSVLGFHRSSFTVLGGFRWPERLTDGPSPSAARPSHAYA